ncbi:hypothetical protein, partial [Demequina zhanjiangensis]
MGRRRHTGQTHAGLGSAGLATRTSIERLLDSFAVPLFLVGLDGRIAYINDVSCRTIDAMDGMTPDALLGQLVQEFANATRISTNPHDYPRTSRFEINGGIVETTLSLLTDDADEPLGFTYAWEDRTEHLRIRNASHETAEEIITIGATMQNVTVQLTDQAQVTSDGAQTAAAAIEQMSASVQEIANSTTNAVAIANEAVGAAGQASERVTKLEAS